MTKDLTTIAAEATPARIRAADHVRAVVDRLGAQLEWSPGKGDTLPELPTISERSRLHERSRDLTSILRPASMAVADQERMGVAVGMMLGGFLLKDANPQETIGGYCLLLQDLPAWAVIEACAEFARGEATETVVVDGVSTERRLSPDFAPKAARVHLYAAKKVEALKIEQAKIQRLMNARLPDRMAMPDDPVMRDKVAGLMSGLANKMNAKQVSTREAERAAAREADNASAMRAAQFKKDADDRRLARYAALGLKPVYIGDLLCDPDALPDKHRYRVGAA